MFTRCCLGQKKVPVPWKILEHCMVPIMGDSQGEPSQTVHVIECVPLCRMHKSGADFLSLSCESPRLSSVVDREETGLAAGFEHMKVDPLFEREVTPC